MEKPSRTCWLVRCPADCSSYTAIFAADRGHELQTRAARVNCFLIGGYQGKFSIIKCLQLVQYTYIVGGFEQNVRSFIKYSAMWSYRHFDWPLENVGNNDQDKKTFLSSLKEIKIRELVIRPTNDITGRSLVVRPTKDITSRSLAVRPTRT